MKDIYNDLFEYDGKELRWKIAKAARISIGDVAGGINKSTGYLMTRVNRVLTLNHRIIWMMVNGAIPDAIMIDHINGVITDNRIENLRMVTRSGNGKNRKISSNNKSGVPGVSINSRGKFVAYISHDGKQFKLGAFNTLDEAKKARLDKEVEFGYINRNSTFC